MCGFSAELKSSRFLTRIESIAKPAGLSYSQPVRYFPILSLIKQSIDSLWQFARKIAVVVRGRTGMPIVMALTFRFAPRTIGIHFSNCAEIAEIVDAVAVEGAYRRCHVNFPF